MWFTEAESIIFARRRRPKVSHWAAENIIVPDGPYAGARYRRDVNPYLAGIMDAWGERDTEEVVVCGAPQTGKTLVLDICMAYAVDYRKGPRMLAMPDDETMSRIIDAKLRPLLKKCRSVGGMVRKIRNGRIHFSDSTTLWLSSAASPAQRASISVMDLFLDEEALFRQFAGQGVPVTDFLERTNSYAHKRKILRISKPVGDESCSIITALAQMDEVREYHVVCPACGTAQTLEEENVITLDHVQDPARIRREKLGRYRCPHCKFLWTDTSRDRAVAAGFWEARDPVSHPRKIGFYLPGILSSAVSISHISACKAELSQTDDADQHQAYQNGIWAKAYKAVVAKANEHEILQLRDMDLPPKTAPAGSVALTLGIDMQKRGFWFLVCAWSRKLDCTIIDYGRLHTWDDVYAQVFLSEYRILDSEDKAVIWRAAIDTGGGESDVSSISRTQEAISFITQYGGGILHGTKGASHAQLSPVKWTLQERMPGSKTAIPGGFKLYILDTNFFKTWAVSRMDKNARQPLRLHREADNLLAVSLTSEEQVLERGKRVWKEKARNKNHLFDCLCMNFACVHATWSPSLSRVIGEGVFDIEAEAAPVEAPAPPERKARKKELLW